MRIYADVNRLPNLPASETASVIIQVAPSPAVGVSTPINGKFVVDIPDGVYPPRVTEASRLIDTSSTDYITGEIYENLRRAFAGYPHVVYNPLLTSADVGLLDPTATFPFDPGPPAQSWSSRCQLGRAAAPAGVAPNSVALLPENPYATPPRPGLLITDTIDIGPATGGIGANNFIVYWKVYTMTVTDDVMNYGAGTNTPAIKNLVEVQQDLVGVFLSVNDGAGYTPVSRLSPCVTCDPGTLLRLAFVNHNPFKVYLTAYAVLF
jgi:hypothetical protein